MSSADSLSDEKSIWPKRAEIMKLDPLITTTLQKVREAGGNPGSLYVVGGLLRDLRLNRPPRHANVDLAVPSGAVWFAQHLAKALGGAYVLLDEPMGSARVVIEAADEDGTSRKVELDVNDFRAPTIEEDLRLRDFTFNAMAVRLDDWLANPATPAPLLDPLGGARALADRAIRACFPDTFKADPLRILRAFRFQAELGFMPEPQTQEWMHTAVPLLTNVSWERIRDELFLILETDRAHAAFTHMDKLGILDALLPELAAGREVDQGDFHHLDVLEHQLEALRIGDEMLKDFAEFSPTLHPVLADYCAQPFVEKRTRKGMIKLGALLHDIGKPSMRQVHPDGEIWFIGHEHSGAELADPLARRMCLSNREAEILVTLVRHHLHPGFLSREAQLTRRAIYRFYKDLGESGPACLLMWWCDRMATRGSKSRLDQVDEQHRFLEEMLSAYFFKAEEVVRPPRLVDGHQLMRTFGLKPGPKIGELLALIEEAQAEGRVSSAEEALQLAKEALDNAFPS